MKQCEKSLLLNMFRGETVNINTLRDLVWMLRGSEKDGQLRQLLFDVCNTLAEASNRIEHGIAYAAMIKTEEALSGQGQADPAAGTKDGNPVAAAGDKQ